MLTSNLITAEDAARYDGSDAAAVEAVAGDRAQVFGYGLFVRAANGQPIPIRAGQWVVRFAPGDVGVMDDGEYRRWFGS